MSFQNFGEMRKRCNFVDHTKPACTLTADHVQWLSQSDYSICIRIPVQSNLDYPLKLDKIVWIIEGPDNRKYEY